MLRSALRSNNRIKQAAWPTSIRQYAHDASHPPAALQHGIDDITSRPPTTHHDVLDPLRASQLLRSLPTRQNLPSASVPVSVSDGEALSQGHHMIYFQPETMLRDLGNDGSSPEYNAPAPFTRRMWAGGTMSWPDPESDSSLRVGQKVSEERSIDKVDWKKGMVFIHQKRVVKDTISGVVGVSELRTHVFRPSPPPSSSPSAVDVDVAVDPKLKSESEYETITSPDADVTFTYTPTSPLLFRYSALTFNAHRIHYDRPHTIAIERQPDLLVHGPLTATLLIELAASQGLLSKFTYRAVSPIVVDRPVQLFGWFTDASKRALKLQAVQQGRVGMKATAELYE